MELRGNVSSVFSPLSMNIAVVIVTPAEGPSFGVAPSGTGMWMSLLSNYE